MNLKSLKTYLRQQAELSEKFELEWRQAGGEAPAAFRAGMAVAYADIEKQLGPERRAESAPKVDHPWANFLAARADAIDWLTADGKTDSEIAKTLSMDGEQQVWLIRSRDR